MMERGSRHLPVGGGPCRMGDRQRSAHLRCPGTRAPDLELTPLLVCSAFHHATGWQPCRIARRRGHAGQGSQETAEATSPEAEERRLTQVRLHAQSMGQGVCRDLWPCQEPQDLWQDRGLRLLRVQSTMSCLGDVCERRLPETRMRSGRVCRVFVTRSTHDAKLGGAAGADTICQGLAVAVGLPGVYRAWISDASSSPSTRFVRSTGSYMRVDDVTVAHDWADLTSRTLRAPSNITARGTRVPSDNSRVTWTNTTTAGLRLGAQD